MNHVRICPSASLLRLTVVSGEIEFETNHDESILQKILIRRSNLVLQTKEPADECFPDPFHGKEMHKGQIFRITFPIRRSLLYDWVDLQGKRFARPKELIDFCRAAPRSLLNVERIVALDSSTDETDEEMERKFLSIHSLRQGYGVRIQPLGPTILPRPHWSVLVIGH